MNDDAPTYMRLAQALSRHPEVMVVERSDPTLELTPDSLEHLLEDVFPLAALSPEAPAREGEGGAVHYGDPCIRCGVGHDDVPPGPCRGDGITISRERACAVLDYLKNGRGPAGWPTQLWVEVQHFIANIDAALTPRHEDPAEGAGEREDIARIIDPRGWKAKEQQDAIGAYSDYQVAESLTKADAILALRARSSAPEAREGEGDLAKDVAWAMRSYAEVIATGDADRWAKIEAIIARVRARSSAPEDREGEAWGWAVTWIEQGFGQQSEVLMGADHEKFARERAENESGRPGNSNVMAFPLYTHPAAPNQAKEAGE